MKKLIDIHMLTVAADGKDKAAYTLEQIKEQSVEIHKCGGVIGSVGKARAKGFSIGSLPYSSCVDPGDDVAPGIFTKIASVISRYPEVGVIATNENVCKNGKISYLKATRTGMLTNVLHHLIVVKKSLVAYDTLSAEKDVLGVEIAAAAEAIIASKSLVYIDVPGYTWNVEPGSFSRKAVNRMGLLETELKLIAANPRIILFRQEDFYEDNSLRTDGVECFLSRVYLGGPAHVLHKVKK